MASHRRTLSWLGMTCWSAPGKFFSGDVNPRASVLLLTMGDHTALQAAETIAKFGACLEFMGPDRNLSPDVMGMNLTLNMCERQLASSNGDEVNHDMLVNGAPQTIRSNPDGAFQLLRIGDAVSARNIHATTFDGLRFVRVL